MILFLQKVPTSNTEGGWSFSLAEYVRHNDMPIYEASERVLRAFQDELMPAESLSEFFDVVGQYAHTPMFLADTILILLLFRQNKSSQIEKAHKKERFGSEISVKSISNKCRQ